MDIEKIEQMLCSTNPQEVQTAAGLAALALLKELRQNRETTTMNKRAPVDGDIASLPCTSCEKITEHIFHKCTHDNETLFAEWTCGQCQTSKRAG